MRKVLIPTKLDKFAADWLIERNYNVILDAATPIADLFKANPDAEVVIVRSEKITPELIDLLPELKLIVRAGAGFNTIDIKYARKKNIDVMNTPGANSNAVAEEVVAMILAAYRFVVPADNTTRAGEWNKKKYMGRELTGKTVGILGLGNIGRLLVKRLQGFECTLVDLLALYSLKGSDAGDQLVVGDGGIVQILPGEHQTLAVVGLQAEETVNKRIIAL